MSSTTPPFLPLCGDQQAQFVEAGLLIELGQLLIRRRRVVVPEPYSPSSKENAGDLEKAIEQAQDRIAESYSTRKDRSHSKIVRHICVESREQTRIEPRLLRIIAYMAAKLVLENESWISVYDIAKAAALNPADPTELLELRRVVATLAVESTLDVSDAEFHPAAVTLSKGTLSLLLGGSRSVADMSPTNIRTLRQWLEEQRLLGPPDKRKKASQASPASQATTANLVPLDVASPKALYDHLRSIVIGQDEACRVLAVRGWLHLKRKEILQGGRTVGRNECLFFAGPSGSGKTYLSESFGKCFGLPFTSFSATDASAVGYVGLDICEDSLKALMRSTGEGNVKDAAAKARYGILLLDEWTKKVSRPDANGKDLTGTSVQQEILRLMEGCVMALGYKRVDRDSSAVEFNSNGLMTVFCGHAEGFEKVIHRLKRKKSGLGFSTLHEGIARNTYLQDALVDYGFIPEWVNRLSAIAFFNRLQRADLMKIATLTDGPIAGYNALLSAQGLQIQINEDGIAEMADLCIETGLMARGLRLTAAALVEEAVFEGKEGVVVFGRAEVRHAIDRVASLDDRAATG